MCYHKDAGDPPKRITKATEYIQKETLQELEILHCWMKSINKNIQYFLDSFTMDLHTAYLSSPWEYGGQWAETLNQLRDHAAHQQYWQLLHVQRASENYPSCTNSQPISLPTSKQGQAFLPPASNPHRLQHLPMSSALNLYDNVTPPKHSQTGRNTNNTVLYFKAQSLYERLGYRLTASYIFSVPVS